MENICPTLIFLDVVFVTVNLFRLRRIQHIATAAISFALITAILLGVVGYFIPKNSIRIAILILAPCCLASANLLTLVTILRKERYGNEA